MKRSLSLLSCPLTMCLVVSLSVLAQETTGSLQGTVKDPSGAVVAFAHVSISTPTLAGGKTADTDPNGYYHFSNLPPGPYVVTVEAKGFASLKREGLVIEVGHSPTLDLTLSVGSESTVVEVTAQGPQIDVTSTTTHTNITESVIQDIPHGVSFQSAIQFAPSARNEPLEGMSQFSIGNGNGATSPGSGSSGNPYGFMIAGGSDSENSYLVEGQETANLIGGNSHTNVPFDFIDEMVMDTSGITAEHGGALGGVINVIMQKGSNSIHGVAWIMFNEGAMNGSPRANPRYDPNASTTPLSSGYSIDDGWQQYQPKKYHTSDVFPGFRIGMPLVKDKVFLFGAFSPEWSNQETTVSYNYAKFAPSTFPGQPAHLSFGQNTQTYYVNLRVDAALGKKIHVFGSLLDQGQHQSGENLPTGDDVHGLFNIASSVNPIGFEHTLGYAAPNTTYNLGLDYTASSTIVLTSRFGYFFENYHDFGYPTTGAIDLFFGSGVGGTDVNGAPLPSDLQEPNGYFNQPNSQTYTLYNADKRTQFDQDVAFYKSGWFGTHNFKFGYHLNKSNNNIYQRWPAPAIQVFPGSTESYSPAGDTGAANCATLAATVGLGTATAANGGNCSGQYGYVIVWDYGTKGQATSYANAFYGEDSWNFGNGLTINYGLRVEKENVPSENNAAGLPSSPIQFGWNDKLAPRVGFAWDPRKDGKQKLFGSYGSFTDEMKLNVAIGSFGGQYWQNCAYALNDPNLADIVPVFDSDSRYCYADSANFGGSTPAGISFIESLNNRGTEGVVTGLKPYRQHESVLGYDYQVTPSLAFEARWDRRRLDSVIEDAALFDSGGNEIFTIVNPGFGPNAVNATCATAGAYVYHKVSYPYAACPQDPKAARSYDGLEFRLTKNFSNHWSGMLSYTYSSFRGNYYGLTNGDEADGGGGRNAPNNSRAFDETYFSFNAYGGSSSGKLAEDRPNALKGYGSYAYDEGHSFKTTIGIFQDAYSGTPQSSFVDVGYSIAGGGNFGQFPVFPENRGKWVDVSQSPTTGAITVGNAYTKRTPWFTQTDLNIKQAYKVTEGQTISFDATITNAFNQHEVVGYYGSINSAYVPTFLTPGTPAFPFYYGAIAYSTYEHTYPWKTLMNTDHITVNSQYGKPYEFQVARQIRLQLHYTF